MAVQFTPSSDFLFINVDGVWDLETAKITQNNAIRLMNEHGLSKLILDLSNVENKFTFPDIQEITLRVPEIFPPNYKHAIVFSYSAFTVLEIEYSGTMSFNRGVNISMFKTVEKAKQWLLLQK